MKKRKKKKIRPLGEILLDIEPLILEAAEDHDLQHGDFYGILHAYLDVHLPDNKEVYTEDGSSPVFFYGHKSRIK